MAQLHLTVRYLNKILNNETLIPEVKLNKSLPSFIH